MTSRSLAPAVALLFLLASPVLAGEHKYTGVKDCSRCHKKELIGDQYGEWKTVPVNIFCGLPGYVAQLRSDALATAD